MVQYCRPRDLSDALERLEEANGRGRVLVGGTDLLVHVRRQPTEPVVLIDIKTAIDLPPAVEITDELVRFGPTAVMSSLAVDPQLRAWFPALVDASAVVGSVAIRNRASLIGNICNASPACDTAPALLVHDARVTILSQDGTRSMPLTDFFLAPGRTACASGELVIALDVPIPANGFRSGFQRLTRRRGVDLATVSAAAGVTDRGVVTLGLGAVAPTPLLTAESAPIDCADADQVAAVVDELTAVANPISDVRAGREYRLAMTRVLAKRAVLAAAQIEEAS